MNAVFIFSSLQIYCLRNCSWNTNGLTLENSAYYLAPIFLLFEMGLVKIIAPLYPRSQDQTILKNHLKQLKIFRQNLTELQMDGIDRIESNVKSLIEERVGPEVRILTKCAPFTLVSLYYLKTSFLRPKQFEMTNGEADRRMKYREVHDTFFSIQFARGRK